MSDNKLHGMPINEALARFSQTDPKEVAKAAIGSMKDGDIEGLISAFEAEAKTDETGVEFWTARSLQKLLDYTDYRNFLNIVDKAKNACKTSGQHIDDHFVDINEMIELGKSAVREIDDIRLSRYACYLITQNGDPRKKPVAFGQTYFAIQTRRQELFDQANAEEVIPLSEDQKRVFLRNQIKEHNKYLSSAAKEAGVITPQDFAIFHSKGYQGMYGKTVPEIRRYKGLSGSADILDRMGSTELAANFFRVTQTEEKLRKDGIRGKQKAYDTHYAIGRQVRDAMLKISGTAPEDLPAVEHIKEAEKRLKMAPPTIPSALHDDTPESLPDDVPNISALVDDRRPINLRSDLWKYALLIMATRRDGIISTSNLISELPDYIKVPEGSQEVLSGRKDSKFSQLVRNLKSHKTTKTNFIYQGYAEAIAEGFKITAKGREFVKSYFSE
jgi:hypothetical protein